jgi:hypothetical protein
MLAHHRHVTSDITSWPLVRDVVSAAQVASCDRRYCSWTIVETEVYVRDTKSKVQSRRRRGPWFGGWARGINGFLRASGVHEESFYMHKFGKPNLWNDIISRPTSYCEKAGPYMCSPRQAQAAQCHMHTPVGSQMRHSKLHFSHQGNACELEHALRFAPQEHLHSAGCILPCRLIIGKWAVSREALFCLRE